jgi:hypothetical protein
VILLENNNNNKGMPMTMQFGNSHEKELDIEAIRDVFNDAQYKSEVVIAKGAPVPRVSRFATQPEVDEKYQRVNSTLTVNVQTLPQRELRFVLDAFDRFSGLENGMLLLKENCVAADYDGEKVKSRILDYAHKKIDKAYADEPNYGTDFELPKQQVLPQNEQAKTGLFGWLKENVINTQSFGR